MYKSALAQLDSKVGNGTELISLYIPGSKQVADILGRLRDEYSSCGNIKSKQTRTNVQRALSAIIARLPQYKQFPENGVIVFCGEVVAERGDKTEFEYHAIEPPNPVHSFKYQCDAKFDLDEARTLAEQTDAYALVVLDLKEACWGTVDGMAVRVSGTYDSIVPNKHGQGGSSQHRFEQLREIAINEYFIKLAERVNNTFIGKPIKGILIGGCGMTKDAFVKGDYLHHELRKIVIGTFDTAYTNEHGLYELVNVAKDKLTDLNSTSEKKTFDDFLRVLAKDTGRVAYGDKDVLDKIGVGQAKQVIISTARTDLFEQLTRNETNYEVVTISKDSESGAILDKAFNGVVAVLRYT